MNPAPAPKSQRQKMQPSTINRLVFSGEAAPFNSGSSRNTACIPQKKPDTVNSKRNNAEQHNIRTLE